MQGFESHFDHGRATSIYKTAPQETPSCDEGHTPLPLSTERGADGLGHGDYYGGEFDTSAVEAPSTDELKQPSYRWPTGFSLKHALDKPGSALDRTP